MHEFKHPNYYKELRKRNKTGQAISDSHVIKDSSDRLERATGPGHKLQAREDSTANSTRGQVAEPQASSAKQQATSHKPQAPSDKHQAPSDKHQV